MAKQQISPPNVVGVVVEVVVVVEDDKEHFLQRLAKQQMSLPVVAVVVVLVGLDQEQELLNRRVRINPPKVVPLMNHLPLAVEVVLVVHVISELQLLAPRRKDPLLRHVQFLNWRFIVIMLES